MALLGDAVMVILCDFAGDPRDHDDWHTYEHMHERLSIPGFLRGSRWIREEGSPRYLIFYEVESVAMARSPAYLERLDHPTAWTRSTMKDLRNMRRGFCTVGASGGYGLGTSAFILRFEPPQRAEWAWLAEVVREIAREKGLASAVALHPEMAPPMTTEQSLRGRDAELGCVLLVTAHDRDALKAACERHLGAGLLAKQGIATLDRGFYSMGFTATAAEVARTAANPARVS